MPLRFRFFRTLLSAAALAVWTSTAYAQSATSLDVYLSGPDDIGVPYADTTVETWEGLSTGNRTSDYLSAIGTYRLSTTSAFNIQNDNQYGAGAGKYMAFGAQSGTSGAITLDLASPARFRGTPATT